jgi:hypothetical protein
MRFPTIRWLRSFRIRILIGVLLFCWSPASFARNSYDEAMVRIRAFSGSPYVRLLPFGRSFEGRNVPAYLISDFANGSPKKIRILVLAGQHGDEHNPIWSTISISAKLASGIHRDLLKRCLFLFIPIANPDGFIRHSRQNAQGVDLNRDWKSLRSPETRYVDGLIRIWKPHLLLDLHEWTANGLVNGNEIEVPNAESLVRRQHAKTFAQKVASRSGLAVVQSHAKGNSTLFHRHYSAEGFAAFLIETSPYTDPSHKRKLYGDVVTTAAATACGLGAISLMSPSSNAFSISAVSAYLRKPSSSLSAYDRWGRQLSILICLVFCVFIYAIKISQYDNVIGERAGLSLLDRWRYCSPNCFRTISEKRRFVHQPTSGFHTNPQCYK